jgi:hypothetical protein
MSKPRLVFDVDGVAANFIQAMIDSCEEYGDDREDLPCCWKHHAYYDQMPKATWDRIKDIGSSFWMGIKPLPGVRRKMIQHGIFPDLYLTSRPIDSAITAQWIFSNLFPTAEVVTVPRAVDKMEHLKEGDVFVDDLPSTVRMAQNNGVTALLMDAPFHRGEQESLEGLTIIKCVSEVAKYL